jgi:hypothetical protein
LIDIHCCSRTCSGFLLEVMKLGFLAKRVILFG